jgi:hypothetical protein
MLRRNIHPEGDLMRAVRWLCLPCLLVCSVARSEPPANKMDIEWELLTASLSGGTNNGWANPCDDPKQPVKTLVLVVKNAKHEAAETRLACPRGQNRGVFTINLPDAAGPYWLRATSPDRPALKSEHVKSFTVKDTVHLRIYAAGCDAQSCQ